MSETRCVRDTDGDGDCAACARNPHAPCRVPVLTYEDVQNVLDKVYEEAYRDSLGNPPPDIITEHKLDGETRAETKERLYAQQLREYRALMTSPVPALPPKTYHRGPRSYVQYDGKPYNTSNPRHFLNRYGMRLDGVKRWPELAVGVWKTTVETMMVESIRERQAVRTMNIIADEGWT